MKKERIEIIQFAGFHFLWQDPAEILMQPAGREAFKEENRRSLAPQE